MISLTDQWQPRHKTYVCWQEDNRGKL